MGVVGGVPVAEDPAAAGGGQAVGGGHVVLDGDGQAGQEADVLAGVAPAVYTCGPGAGGVGADGGEGVDGRFEPLDGRQARLGGLGGGDLASAEGVAQVAGCPVEDGHG